MRLRTRGRRAVKNTHAMATGRQHNALPREEVAQRRSTSRPCQSNHMLLRRLVEWCCRWQKSQRVTGRDMSASESSGGERMLPRWQWRGEKVRAEEVRQATTAASEDARTSGRGCYHYLHGHFTNSSSSVCCFITISPSTPIDHTI